MSIVDQNERGTLWVLEGKNIPFPIARIYTMSGVKTKVPRGNHAHKKTDQFIFAVNGAFTLGLDDGKKKENVRLHSGNSGVHLPPLLWHTMSDFTPDCVALVVASAPYDEADYIRDYDEFRKYAGTV